MNGRPKTPTVVSLVRHQAKCGETLREANRKKRFREITSKEVSPARFTSVSQKPSPDVLVVNLGTLFAFCPLTTRAKEWIDENVQDDLNGSEIRLLWKPGTRGDWQRA